LRNLIQAIAKHRFVVALWAGIATLLVCSFEVSGLGVTAWLLSGCSLLRAIGGGSYSMGAPNSAQYAPVRFEPNVGQADPEFRYIAHGTAHSIYLAPSEAVFSLRHSSYTSSKPRVVRAVLEGASNNVAAEAQEPMSGRVNYLIGNDPRKWHTDIPTFGKVTFHGVYPGIDVVYHGTGGFLENDFVVQPGGDPAAIRIHFSGADNISLEKGGILAVAAGRSTLRWKAPYIYQRGEQGQLNQIEGRFKTPKEGVVEFEVGVYDVHRPLVIDPLLTYATYLGSANTEAAVRVAADSSGNAYMVGGSDDGTFPSTPGAYASNTSGLLGQAIITKLTPDGKSLIYETHIGGGSGNMGFGIAVDLTGNAYVTGMTASADFPLVPSGNNLTTKNITDPLNCFVSKLNASGNALVYSTVLGGGSADGCSGIGVDSAGEAIVVGGTGSNDFPLVDAAQSQFPGGSFGSSGGAAFVSKLSADGTKLLYSTYYGGTGDNAATAVAVDAAGNAYFTGFTTSSSFPVTAGAAQTQFGGSGGQNSTLDTLFPTGNMFGFAVADTFGDAFVVKLNPSGQKVYSTYLGGAKDDIGFGIAIDSSGNAYVGGATLSGNFPVQNAFQATYKGAGGNSVAAGGDGFITEIDPTGAQFLFSSYIGGAADDRVLGVGLDSSGNVYLVGHTLSKDFPTAGQSSQNGYGGDAEGFFPTGDAFLTEVDTTHKLAFSTYFGGSSGDWASGVAVDGTGGVIVAGATDSTDFPVTSGVVQSQYAGSDTQLAGVGVGDAFIARFGGSTSAVTIGGVSNAASFVGGAIAPGEAILIAGTSIGPATLVQAQLDANGNISTMVSDTQFTFNGVPAPIVYVSQQYSSVIVPYEVAKGSTAQIVATYKGTKSAPFTIPVVSALPGIFSANSSGTGQGAIYNQNLSHNSAAAPAARGSTVILFVTGEGQTVPPGADGVITSSMIEPAQPVTVSFGGVAATNYAYVGEAPGVVAGVLQINVTVPDLAPTGSSVPVTVSIGSIASQAGITAAIQ